MKNIFTKQAEPKEGIYVLVTGEYEFSSMPYIEAWCIGGSDMMTEVVPGISVAEDEVILNHDILFNKEMTEAFIDYIGTGERRTIKFGNFDAETLVIRLKENWEDLCFSEREWFGEEAM